MSRRKYLLASLTTHTNAGLLWDPQQRSMTGPAGRSCVTDQLITANQRHGPLLRDVADANAAVTPKLARLRRRSFPSMSIRSAFRDPAYCTAQYPHLRMLSTPQAAKCMMHSIYCSLCVQDRPSGECIGARVTVTTAAKANETSFQAKTHPFGSANISIRVTC